MSSIKLLSDLLAFLLARLKGKLRNDKVKENSGRPFSLPVQQENGELLLVNDAYYPGVSTGL